MPRLHLKYVRDEDDNFVIFNKTNHAVAHSDFKFSFGKIKSAGFMGTNRISGRIMCDGRSESLNKDSLPIDDSEFFSRYFKHAKPCFIFSNSTVVFASNMPIETFEKFNVEMVTNHANIMVISTL